MQAMGRRALFFEMGRGPVCHYLVGASSPLQVKGNAVFSRLLLALLITTPFMAQQPPAVFTPKAPWLELQAYAATVCNPTPLPLTISGDVVFRDAQNQGMQPRTQVDLQAALDQAKKTSPSARALLAVKLAGLGFTAFQSISSTSERWSNGVKAIAPSATILAEAAPHVFSDAFPDLPRIPDDYPRGLMRIDGGGCWVGTIVGVAR